MKKLKYVCYEDNNGMEQLIIFHPSVSHRCMTEGIKQDQLLSAGFIENGKCVGESITLGIKSREDDQELFDVLYKSAIIESMEDL